MTLPRGGTRVFVSYSRETEEHNNWVLRLVQALRKHDIDAFNDETALKLGERIPEFMEMSVRDSDRVLVICTEVYKQRFDQRKGGAGYEGNVITGEIVNEVGKNKFIPVLRKGDWTTAVPTALLGINGVDLRSDSAQELQKLVQNLSEPLQGSSLQSGTKYPGKANALRRIGGPMGNANAVEQYWKQRGKIAETDLLKRMWPKARWCIWIYPVEFRLARFRNIEDCKRFVTSARVPILYRGSFPTVLSDKIETGDEWISCDIEADQNDLASLERWILYRSGQFVHRHSLGQRWETGDEIHALEILYTVTATFEFAAKMADRGILSPEGVITFELWGIDGHALTWPEAPGGNDRIGRDCWSQEPVMNLEDQFCEDDLKRKSRELALETAMQIYARFGWSEPLEDKLRDIQRESFG